MFVALKALGKHAVISIAQRKLEMSNIAHQRLPKHEVPLMELKRQSNIVVAYIKIGREPCS